MEEPTIVDETAESDGMALNSSADEDIADIAQIVEQYLYGFVDSINNNDFTYLENALAANSPIYIEQMNYVTNTKAFEKLISYKIRDIADEGHNTCKITLYEKYEIDNYKTPVHMKEFENSYTLKKENDRWLFYSLDSLTVLE